MKFITRNKVEVIQAPDKYYEYNYYAGGSEAPDVSLQSLPIVTCSGRWFLASLAIIRHSCSVASAVFCGDPPVSHGLAERTQH